MAITNFIPEIWSARIKLGLQQQMVFGNIVNRNYEGDITKAGDTVHIGQIGDITVNTYIPNTTVVVPEELDGTDQVLNIDQAKYFAFYVDDVDATQANVNLLGTATANASRQLMGAADAYLVSLLSAAGLAGDIQQLNAGALAYPDVLPTIAEAAAMLNVAGASRDGRWMVVPAWLEALMVQSNIELNTNNSPTLSNGYIGRFMGFEVYSSNSVPVTGATPAFGTEGDSQIFVGTREGITFADQLMKIEAYRPEGKFADAVKGLHVYGAAIVEPQALLMISASKA